jgi:NAD+ synthase (glutamine-hydrolysing)
MAASTGSIASAAGSLRGMTYLRLAGAQLNTVVGDLDGNVERILGALSAAEEAGADICVVPELAIPGYPPEDLLLKPSFVVDNVAALEKVAAATGQCAIVVGYVGATPDGQGLSNAAALCAGGRVVGIYRKRFLPNYGVFDEQRWFVSSNETPTLFGVAGAWVGISVCEDVWFPDGPVARQGHGGADVVVNLNASPYNLGRHSERLAMLQGRVAEAGCAIAYVNQVGGQDELVFDGDSLIVAADGTLLAGGTQFTTDLVVVDIPIAGGPGRTGPSGGTALPRVVATEPRPAPAADIAPLRPALGPLLSPEAEVYTALVLGTRDYLGKNGFSEAVIGLSGGIDSSLVATIAVDALGPSHVHGISMPSRYSSDGSRHDAEALATLLGIDLSVVPIEDAHVAFTDMLTGTLGQEPTGLTDENLQSRLRGVLLMGVSNAKGWIVLTTGNKSEMATGYSTLYGDSAGGFAVIKDVPKTLVYDLCRYRNAQAVLEGLPGPIPESVLDKAPSAELRPDQRDDQSLPPYEKLDPVLQGYVEGDRTASDLVAEGFDPVVVEQVVRLVDGAEYKRRQMPPGVRITTKAFGKDRRMPITNHYRPPLPEEPRHG